MTIRTKFSLSTLVTVALVLAALALVLALLQNQDALIEAQRIQFESRRLANELRYSSDELTRTARTYTVTGDPRHRDEYWHILAVRDGTAARPDGRTVPLRRLLQDIGITADELGRLTIAEDNSNALVATEVAAFQAMEGRFLPQPGPASRDATAYTRHAPADPDFAARIMHDDAYHADKERIMAPIRDFEHRVAVRTQAAVDRLADRGHTLMLVITALVVLLIAVAFASHLLVQRPVLASIRLVTRELEDLAGGNVQLARRLHVHARDEVGDLAAAFNATLERLAALVRDVREAAGSVVSRAEEMGELLTVLQASVEQQDASTHSTSVATHEIAVTSGELRQSTRAMTGSAEDTRRVVTDGERGLRELGENMTALVEGNRRIVARLSTISEKAGQITAMADVIRGVAEHSDLLSLNAAIEAEKAGQYGRGFGVVAREIRRLADQSAAAVTDIEVVVNDVRSAIGAGVMETDRFGGQLVESVTAVQTIEQQLGGMIQEVQTLLSLLQDLGASFTGQDEGVQQIRADMETVSTHAKATADALARARDTRSHMEDTGRRLRDLVERMRT